MAIGRMDTKIGVLALQGGVVEHENMLKKVGADPVAVRLPEHLAGLSGLIIPGGESTTIGKLSARFGLMEPMRAFAGERPVWGTCAGMIFLARDIGMDQPLLGVMNITVERNAFGSQLASFATELTVPDLEEGSRKPFPAVFIRAPKLVAAHGEVRVMAHLPDGTPVAAREGHWLATAFHPELTGDTRFHRYFLDMVLEHTAR